MKKILLVEDHAIVRLATRFLILDLLNPVVVYEAGSFSETLTQLSHSPADLVVLDINIPDGEGFNMIPKIREIQPKVLIMIFSSLEEEIYALHYMKAGANGFLSKNASQEEIKKAILSMLEAGNYISTAVQQQLLRNTVENKPNGENPLEHLSQRELEVMDMLIEGYWTKEIAIKLNLTESSVSTYKSRIFDKLKVSTLIEMFKKVQFYKSRNPGI
ncbi:response regulator [Dyadobacter fermentans]|uniref:Two component transcriptional regulator, LuxR family n=1 Tax=Dyadobacter fermentans (strain ATCC 700827 / DSM 18053 / CIP 107007 / KCTC 52180 / NS114) TaxID=471854 RepID=C6W654_DYAFD|nr:response regulator transcription factor [Dyadobacter fermentans]ACT92534.1 two component transcriptional regulator, LuxR family [Dyadobacter fermentans DSM 18053]